MTRPIRSKLCHLRRMRRLEPLCGALLLTIVMMPAMSRASEVNTTTRVTPLCTAFIRNAQQWAVHHAEQMHPLSVVHKREIAREAAEQVKRDECDKPYFQEQNRSYVTQRRKFTRELAKRYHALLARLHGAARAQLIRDQTRWDHYHAREVTNPENVINTFVARIDRLRQLTRELAFGPYPFVSDHPIIRNLYFKYGSLHTDAHYPQFDNGGVDAAATNRFFARSAVKAVAAMKKLSAAVLSKPQPPDGPIRLYGYMQWFTLNRPGPSLLDVNLVRSKYTGGVGPYGGQRSYLIDLRTDGRVSLEQIFKPGVHWRRHLLGIVERRFAQKYGAKGTHYIKPSDIAQALHDPSNYFFQHGSLNIDLTYNWPLVQFSVNIPYSQIHSLLRTHGLVAARPKGGADRQPQ